MDVQAAQARRLHREAEELVGTARQLRSERDRLVRQLRQDDPKFWTYGRLAKAVGVSKELIFQIITHR